MVGWMCWDMAWVRGGECGVGRVCVGVQPWVEVCGSRCWKRGLWWLAGIRAWVCGGKRTTVGCDALRRVLGVREWVSKKRRLNRHRGVFCCF